jgi:hypothetical protein
VNARTDLESGPAHSVGERRGRWRSAAFSGCNAVRERALSRQRTLHCGLSSRSRAEVVRPRRVAARRRTGRNPCQGTPFELNASRPPAVTYPRRPTAGQASGERPAYDPPDTAENLHLRRRRHEWAWAAVGSLLGLVAYLIVGVTYFQSLTGTLAVISVVPLFGLLALILAALVVVLVDTVRLRRLDAAVRAHGADGVLDAALDGRPRRRGAGWRWPVRLAAGCLALVAVVYLPGQVDAVALLAGAGHQDTFVPVSYSQVCGKAGCSTVTDGILAESGADVTWPAQVPLGRSFTVRAPVWVAGSGTHPRHRRRGRQGRPRPVL